MLDSASSLALRESPVWLSSSVLSRRRRGALGQLRLRLRDLRLRLRKRSVEMGEDRSRTDSPLADQRPSRSALLKIPLTCD